MKYFFFYHCIVVIRTEFFLTNFTRLTKYYDDFFNKVNYVPGDPANGSSSNNRPKNRDHQWQGANSTTDISYGKINKSIIRLGCPKYDVFWYMYPRLNC